MSKLFSKVTLGSYEIAHRVVLAPLTRSAPKAAHAPAR